MDQFIQSSDLDTKHALVSVGACVRTHTHMEITLSQAYFANTN